MNDMMEIAGVQGQQEKLHNNQIDACLFIGFSPLSFLLSMSCSIFLIMEALYK